MSIIAGGGGGGGRRRFLLKGPAWASLRCGLRAVSILAKLIVSFGNSSGVTTFPLVTIIFSGSECFFASAVKLSIMLCFSVLSSSG
jgi:hypothetical protein